MREYMKYEINGLELKLETGGSNGKIYLSGFSFESYMEVLGSIPVNDLKSILNKKQDGLDKMKFTQYIFSNSISVELFAPRARTAKSIDASIILKNFESYSKLLNKSEMEDLLNLVAKNATEQEFMKLIDGFKNSEKILALI